MSSNETAESCTDSIVAGAASRTVNNSHDSAGLTSLLLRSKTSLNFLKTRHQVSKWNRNAACYVYGGFKVKRYHVDLKYIFCPTGRKADCRYTLNAVCSSKGKPQTEIQQNFQDYTTWKQVKQLIKRYLDVFDRDAWKVGDQPSDSLSVEEGQVDIMGNVKLAMEGLQKQDKWHFKDFGERTIETCRRLIQANKNEKTPAESLSQNHLNKLIQMFVRIVAPGIDPVETLLDKDDFLFKLMDYSHPFRPKPDLILYGSNKITAVAEVKHIQNEKNKKKREQTNASKFSTKNKKKQELTNASKCSTKNKKKQEQTNTRDVGLEPPAKRAKRDDDVQSDNGDNSEGSTASNSCDDTDEALEKTCDYFDMMECAVDETPARIAALPSSVRNLTFEEKRSLRCVLPELFAEMLAFSHHDRNNFFPDVRLQNYRLGITVVGFKARFVTLLIKDTDCEKEDYKPTAADIQKYQSVRPYLYVTDELNLFKKSDLKKFFKVLYVMGYHCRVFGRRK